jgi:hypothetical protein
MKNSLKLRFGIFNAAESKPAPFDLQGLGVKADVY